MLLRFGVANHRSIRNYQELYLSASKRIKRKGLVLPVPTLKEDAVPIVALYGANASGKSNLIDAFDEFRQIIVRSHTWLDATDDIPRYPFRLDNIGNNEPTQFDCTFMIGKKKTTESSLQTNQSVYEYGFEFVDKEFRREWLYRIVRKERQSTQMLFERTTENGQVHVETGSQLRGENKTIANLTRPNSLFLSASAQNNHPLLTDLYRYFAKKWTVILEAGAMPDVIAAKRLSDFKHKERLLSLVRQADIGIVDFDVEDEEVEGERAGLARDIAGVFSKHLSKSEENEQFDQASILEEMLHLKRINFTHSGGDHTASFGYPMESKGTKTLVSLLIPALEALARGSVLIIDELDTSLHPNLARAFISLFVKSESNPYGAQIIFSTHDIALLGSGLIGKDQIWMTDKSEEGISQFTPLTEFNLRSRDDIEKAYRLGRLGGVPVSDDFFINLLKNLDSKTS